MEAGAKEVAVMATHLVMAGKARQRFEESSITRVIGSDTYPGRKSDDFFDIYSVAPLLAKVLKRHLRL